MINGTINSTISARTLLLKSCILQIPLLQQETQQIVEQYKKEQDKMSLMETRPDVAHWRPKIYERIR